MALRRKEVGTGRTKYVSRELRPELKAIRRVLLRTCMRGRKREGGEREEREREKQPLKPLNKSSVHGFLALSIDERREGAFQVQSAAQIVIHGRAAWPGPAWPSPVGFLSSLFPHGQIFPLPAC